MNAEKENKELTVEKASASRESSSLAYWLVVIMLGILAVLICLLLVLPLMDGSDKLMEYYKWTLSVLLGAFGAWIGAGAAYFFGRENLHESNASTERAMKIQQDSFRRPSGIERIKDMTLTAMNPQFMFQFDSKKAEVRQKLTEYKGYWFVPVVNHRSGVLEDIIHAQVFWENTFFKDKDDGIKDLKDLVSEMDQHDEYKKLHGDLFYAKVSPNDKIKEVYDLLNKIRAEVAIVVDEKGISTHCVTKTELRTFLKV